MDHEPDRPETTTEDDALYAFASAHVTDMGGEYVWMREEVFGYDDEDGFHPVISLRETTNAAPDVLDGGPPEELLAIIEAVTGFRFDRGEARGVGEMRMPPPAPPYREKRGGVILDNPVNAPRIISEELQSEMYVPTDWLPPGFVLYRVRRACASCGKQSSLMLPTEQVEEYESGALAQNAFPDLPKEIREIIVGGIHPVCWEQNVRDEEDTDGPE